MGEHVVVAGLRVAQQGHHGSFGHDDRLHGLIATYLDPSVVFRVGKRDHTAWVNPQEGTRQATERAQRALTRELNVWDGERWCTVTCPPADEIAALPLEQQVAMFAAALIAVDDAPLPPHVAARFRRDTNNARGTTVARANMDDLRSWKHQQNAEAEHIRQVRSIARALLSEKQ